MLGQLLKDPWQLPKKRRWTLLTKNYYKVGKNYQQG